jgi:hypothetical protein
MGNGRLCRCPSHFLLICPLNRERTNAMQQEIITVYRDLMTELGTLPAEIAEAKEVVSKVKFQLAETEAAMKWAEDTIPPKGNNDSERKTNKAQSLASDQAYQRLTAAAKRERSDLAQLEINADKLERQFAAVGYASRLHAGLMGYLAAAGAIPPVDISFGMGKPAKVNGANGNGHVTAKDAEAIGL